MAEDQPSSRAATIEDTTVRNPSPGCRSASPVRVSRGGARPMSRPRRAGPPATAVTRCPAQPICRYLLDEIEFHANSLTIERLAARAGCSVKLGGAFGGDPRPRRGS